MILMTNDYKFVLKDYIPFGSVYLFITSVTKCSNRFGNSIQIQKVESVKKTHTPLLIN